ncbi:MAG: asparagine synthase (glutamine-hydrolyzing) [Chthoniobacterales bacterium]
MCGIAGFFKPRGLAPDDEAHLNRMIDVQYHRGPDGRGTKLDERAGLALGHARLTIVDLHTGCQPLASAAGDADLSLVMNGELYDYKRIRSTLMTEGERFVTKSDSELIMPLYRKHGLDLMPEVRGEFAFALYDRKEDRLALVRDRFGVRPLFYYVSEKGIYFGSEVKVLLAHPDVPCRLDRKAALNQMMQTMVLGTSAFEGIRAVKPGHMLLIKRRGDRLEIEEQKYWDLDFPEADARDLGRSEQDHVETIREELVEAVAHRLEADVPVGCYLSGGIDSCCILGMASGAMQSPVKAFTISFDSDDYDESQIAREMAASVGADQDVIELKAAELYGENFERTVWHAERTFYNTLGVAKFCMSRHVRDAGYKTVITGEGSDELFGGYAFFKRDMFQHGLADEPESVRREYEEALQKFNRIFKGALLSEQAESHPAWESLCGFTPAWIQSWIATSRIARPLLSDDAAAELEGYDPVGAIADEIDPAMLNGRHPLDKSQYSWTKTMLEGQILNWGGDRVDMANSMESRPAFLDHHVAEAAVHVPPNLRIKGNIEKYIVREAVRGVLPEVLYRREKFSFMAPPAHTDEAKQQAVKKLTDRYLNEGSVQEAGLFDAGRVQAFLDGYRNDTDAASLVRKDALLNHLLCLQILHRQYVDGAAPGRA